MTGVSISAGLFLMGRKKTDALHAVRLGYDYKSARCGPAYRNKEKSDAGLQVDITMRKPGVSSGVTQ